MIAGLTFAWPSCAFLCGLYASEDLRTWASGITETPKLALAALTLRRTLVRTIRRLAPPVVAGEDA